MATKRPVTEHGSRGYAYGCRCLTCKAGHAERQRNRRALGSGSRKTVEALAKPRPMGDTERAVLAEVELMTSAPRTADVLACRNLARILDNPKMMAHHARATKEFVSALYIMNPRPSAKRKAKRRLAAVQKITKERTST